MDPVTNAIEKNNLGTPVAIVLGCALIAAALYFGGGVSGVPTVNNQPTQVAVDSSKIDVSGDPYIGNPNAPLTVIEFFDYQCPFCKQVEEAALPQIIQEYVNTGKVKLVYKDFQFLGEDSMTAGIAARAVWEVAPEKFQAWHKAMFDKQDAENGGWGDKADILALTTSVGIDAAKVESLMTKNAAAYQSEMDADKQEGGASGVTGTPGFIIGTQLVAGAQPYEALKAAIDQELK